MIQILVSACLTGENCKWDGGNNRNEALLDFMERMKGKAEFHPVCPEQLGGLSTPRPASEVRENDGVVVNTEDRNVTAEFLLGADLALREAKKYGCTIAILKEKVLPADAAAFITEAFPIPRSRVWEKPRPFYPDMGSGWWANPRSESWKRSCDSYWAPGRFQSYFLARRRIITTMEELKNMDRLWSAACIKSR